MPNSKAKLLRSNFEALKQRIGSHLLTPVFQDSITTATRLGLQYVWIDALCIIQDDDEDWRRESSLMGLVYANAFCNLGASAAAEPGLDGEACVVDSNSSFKGLFASRNPSDFPVAHIGIRWEGTSRLYYGFPHFVRAYLDNTPLLKRGWVLQERLLSPRSIYFGKQLTWECPELLATQIFPEDSPGVRSPCPWNSNAPVRLQNLVLQRNSEALTYAGDIHIDELYRTWLNLIRTYRTCHLTFEEDLFPALSGLAKHFHAQLQDEYLAGLWRKDLIRGLLWHVHSWPREESEQGSSPAFRGKLSKLEEYATVQLTSPAAPSWSWASPETHDITRDIIGDTTNTKLERFLATVQEAAVTLTSDDPTGPVMDGFIRISGYLCANREYIINRHIAGRPFALLESYDSGWEDAWQTPDKQHRICWGTFFFVLTWKPAICIMPAKIRGLILEPTGRNPGEYRRVGAFNMDPAERCEFVGFDPDNFEKQTITII